MTNKTLIHLDDAHASIDFFGATFPKHVWREKYAQPNEDHIFDTFSRVATAVFPEEDGLYETAYEAMKAGIFMPAGRILAGAGTSNEVTLMNCYVSPKVEDSMDSERGTGIMDALKVGAFTQQYGGGIGTAFGTIRPRGAIISRRSNAAASGPIEFMKMWDQMGATIMSAGYRRGAQMGTITDTHPDLLEFIKVKQTPGVMTNFNISILVSDAFMKAVANNDEWLLYFDVPPLHERDPVLKNHDFVRDGKTYYVYSIHDARELWETITKATYEYSEPGVIFIDKVNGMNNLAYCEEIQATNPCGEQPLPPNGTCNLSAINLARLVLRPFEKNAEFDWDTLDEVVGMAVHFLDNVIDITKYPTEAQKQEEINKRRLGLGISGLGDAIAMMRMRYGDEESGYFTRRVMHAIRDRAYHESVWIAQSKGSFPLFDADKFVRQPFIQTLPDHIHNDIQNHGIRNGVLLTIAPTGTTSCVYGNISSGLEPVFAHYMVRKVRSKEDPNKWDEFEDWGYAARLYRHLFGDVTEESLPEFMVTSADLEVEEHLLIQGACQQYVDASVSKTINIPEDYDFNKFQQVYAIAFKLGCKGCTTYRPSDVRGAILSRKSDKKEQPKVVEIKRPEILEGVTFKIEWPSLSSSVYLTINHHDGRPYEIFIAAKDSRHDEWTKALSVLMSAIFRKFEDPTFVAYELKQIRSAMDPQYLGGKFYGSLVSLIGHKLEEHFIAKGIIKKDNAVQSGQRGAEGEQCPRCGEYAVIHSEGCKKCTACGHSTCG